MKILEQLKDEAHENKSSTPYFKIWNLLMTQPYWYTFFGKENMVWFKVEEEKPNLALVFFEEQDILEYQNRMEEMTELKIEKYKPSLVIKRMLEQEGLHLPVVVFNEKDEETCDFSVPLEDLEKLVVIMENHQKNDKARALEFQAQEYNQNQIIKLGGRVFFGLTPFPFTGARERLEIANRVLVMYALFQIAEGAPTYVIREWIVKNKLQSYLSENEVFLLLQHESELTEKELVDLSWYIQGIWTGLWCLSMVNNILFKDIMDKKWMRKYLPKIWEDEDTSRFYELIKTKSDKEIYLKQDLFYRLHWLINDERLSKGEQYLPEIDMNGQTLSGSEVYETRRFLTWVIDQTRNWDQVHMGT